MSTKHYYKKKLVNQNLEVEYNSEDDQITISYDHKLKMGAFFGTDYLRIHPSYVEPLVDLLREVVNPTKKGSDE